MNKNLLLEELFLPKHCFSNKHFQVLYHLKEIVWIKDLCVNISNRAKDSISIDVNRNLQYNLPKIDRRKKLLNVQRPFSQNCRSKRKEFFNIFVMKLWRNLFFSFLYSKIFFVGKKINARKEVRKNRSR